MQSDARLKESLEVAQVTADMWKDALEQEKASSNQRINKEVAKTKHLAAKQFEAYKRKQ